jgi:hypothetical protein
MNNNRKDVEARRAKVAELRSMALTEEEIARELNVNQYTVSRDIKYLKIQSRKFVYVLGRSDLSDAYKRCIDSLELIKKEAFLMFKRESLKPKDKLLALRIMADVNESVFSLFGQGPQVLHIKSINDKIDELEQTKRIQESR